MTLDDKGRCCGRKPLVYKRDRPDGVSGGFLFCFRCDRAYSPEGQQINNWAWRGTSSGEFVENKEAYFRGVGAVARQERDSA